MNGREVINYAEQIDMAATRMCRERMKVDRYIQQYGGYLSGDMVALPVPLSMAQIEEMFDYFRRDNRGMVDVWKKEQP